jgi:hypothetical protein
MFMMHDSLFNFRSVFLDTLYRSCNFYSLFVSQMIRSQEEKKYIFQVKNSIASLES